ncbi:MAG: hypothetical protein GJ676_02815 [Rhodobacteraceae bacterium]|nr:hypothetical protein [Paracoccaceae bacterium]
MVERTILVADNEALTVASNSPFLDEGDPIINNSDSPNGTIYDFSGGMSTIVTLDDTNNVDVFDDDDRFNHVIIDGGGLVPTGTTVESESLIVLRALDGSGTPVGPEITINVYSRDGVTSDIWGFSATDALIPGVQYIKVDGSNNGDSEYSEFVPCFVAGTRIRLDHGRVPVETLKTGQMVWTKSRGLQPVRWIGATTVDGRGAYAPVRFDKGVMGNGKPLLVSPNHRMLHFSPWTQLHFDEEPVLIPARFFVGMPGVSLAPTPEVTYYHFMFDRHEIVESNGCLTESFYPGTQALQGLAAETRNEILDLFPELRVPKDGSFDLAAPELRNYEARLALGTLAA